MNEVGDNWRNWGEDELIEYLLGNLLKVGIGYDLGYVYGF